MTSFPELKTDRLFLRQLVLNDATAIAALRSNDHVNQYLDRPKSTSIDEAANFINKINTNINNNQSFYWAITLQTGELIGTICLWNISDDRLTVEIGFELHPDYQQKGLMREALQTVVSYAFNLLSFALITAYTHEENKKSIELLETSGFKRNKKLEMDDKTAEDSANTNIYTLHKA